MRKNLFCKLHISLQFLLFLGSMVLLPDVAMSQKRQLTPSDTVSKVAFIDHSRLRKEYKGFADAMKKMAAENKSKQNAYNDALSALENNHEKKLRTDSLNVEKQKDKIMSEVSAKRTAMIEDYQAGLKQRMKDRILLIQEYERKIVKAIETIVSEGGFTDVKPIDKRPSEQRGENITDLILKKLN